MATQSIIIATLTSSELQVRVAIMILYKTDKASKRKLDEYGSFYNALLQGQHSEKYYYSLIAFNKGVAFWLQRIRSLPCCIICVRAYI